VLSGSGQGEQIGGAAVAIGEGAVELTAHQDNVAEVANRSEREFVVDVIGEQASGGGRSSGLEFARFGPDVMAVLPIFEWSTQLGVAKVIVPGELRDFRLPRDANGGEGEGTEGEGETGSGAGGDATLRQGRRRTGRRWGERSFFDAGLLPRRHEARKVFGIGEEGEDELRGEGKPLLGVEGVAHADETRERRVETLDL